MARACDVSRPADGRALAEWTIAQYGRLDVLVNNAGVSIYRRHVRWVEQADWDALIAVNLTGVDALTPAGLRHTTEPAGRPPRGPPHASRRPGRRRARAGRRSRRRAAG